MSPFTEVAKLLAGSEPPMWVVPILEDYGRLVAGRKLTKDDEADEKKVLKAALYLQDELAIYAHVGKRYGFEIPEEVDTASQALHELIEYLQSELPSARQGGRIRDGRYRLCAAVCAEVWRRQYKKLQPLSRNLWEACGEVLGWHAASLKQAPRATWITGSHASYLCGTQTTRTSVMISNAA